MWGLNQALITVVKTNCNTNPTNPKPNLTYHAYPPPRIFSPALISRILSTASPALILTLAAALGGRESAYAGTDQHLKLIIKGKNNNDCNFHFLPPALDAIPALQRRRNSEHRLLYLPILCRNSVYSNMLPCHTLYKLY